jgi:hypothetical protein
MAGSVARLPSGSPEGGGGGIPPADVYKVAVEEYRFQAQFNWSRTQYLLAFNAAIFAAAAAVASRPGHSAAGVFALGAVAATMSMFVVHTQHDYYRAVRDHMSRVERDYGLPQDQRLDTTTALGHRKRLASVTQVVYLLLAALVVSNTIGTILVGVLR